MYVCVLCVCVLFWAPALCPCVARCQVTDRFHAILITTALGKTKSAEASDFLLLEKLPQYSKAFAFLYEL